MAISETIEKTLGGAIQGAAFYDAPYHHWLVSDLFPIETLNALQKLPFGAPALDGVSGTREIHNATRVYFDDENRATHPVCAAVAVAFQSDSVIDAISKVFDTDLNGTFLRIEYGQDVDGFWLDPHTDIGVKRFTMLAYLSGDMAHETLGTDVYSDAETWVKRTPFRANLAMAFVPSDGTWHGFEKRLIMGVRKSLIVNFVSDDWRDREQLAFADWPVSRRSKVRCAE